MNSTFMDMDIECGSTWSVETLNNIHPKSVHRLKLAFMMLLTHWPLNRSRYGSMFAYYHLHGTSLNSIILMQNLFTSFYFEHFY